MADVRPELPGFPWPAGRRSATGLSTRYAYYTAGEARADPCVTGSVAVNQGGRAKTTTDAGSNRVQETVYDAAGRVVAARIGTDPWTCTTYDGRGRVGSVLYPQLAGGEPARTVSYNYAVYDAGLGKNNPLVSSVTDPAGTITTTVDLLGRVVSYTDVWGKTTSSTYDQASRLTAANGPAGSQQFSYDNAGRLTNQTLDGATIATPGYTTGGELASVNYPTGGGNGTSLNPVARDDAGRTTALTWNLAGATVTDTVTRSRSGKIIGETVNDGTTANSTFTYDAAGRLTEATMAGRTLKYGYGPATTGPRLTAGLNTNRTTLDEDNGTTRTTTTYGYDAADRLVATSDGRYSSISSSSYDAHGNTISLGTQTLTYDVVDRHVQTINGAATVRYVRDATDRIIERRATGQPTIRYGYTGGGDSAAIVLDAANNNAVLQRTISLPGGLLVTKQSSGDVWSYPNIHGDIIATANAAGAKQGATVLYDPYGQALNAVPDNSASNYDYGWLGQHQRGLEHQDTIRTIEMGARQYIPGLARFIQVDPIVGGSANDYEYCNADPVNCFDLDGRYARTIYFWDGKVKPVSDTKWQDSSPWSFGKSGGGGWSLGISFQSRTEVSRGPAVRHTYNCSSKNRCRLVHIDYLDAEVTYTSHANCVGLSHELGGSACRRGAVMTTSSVKVLRVHRSSHPTGPVMYQARSRI